MGVGYCEALLSSPSSEKLLANGREVNIGQLPSVIWVYRTTLRTTTKENYYSLVYGYEAVLPLEIGKTSARIQSYLERNDEARAQELDLVEEKREREAIRMEGYRRRVIRAYNQIVRPLEFQVGDMVLMKSNWLER
ncbi:uncharacterized protein [Primulina eburnea]|uniref:uncharacterized protein n=1 Tax=Primulina eburnea TaxID=1245227 RepID=UPI003C6BFDEC